MSNAIVWTWLHLFVPFSFSLSHCVLLFFHLPFSDTYTNTQTHIQMLAHQLVSQVMWLPGSGLIGSLAHAIQPRQHAELLCVSD